MEKNLISPEDPEDIESPNPLVDIEKPEISQSENLQKIFRKDLPAFTDSTEFHRGSRSGGVGHQLIAWSFIAAFIDSLILFSMSCFFLIGVSLLVKVRTQLVWELFGGSFYQLGMVMGVSLVVTYMIMLRIFLGYTIGEWACGLRLGSLKQRLHRFYSFKVIARVVLILATGLFVFPLLSMLLGRDLAGKWVGLPIVQQQIGR